MSELPKLPISLQVNCGYARCAIRELTPKNENLDKQKRESELKQLFEPSSSTYGISESYFVGTSDQPSQFECQSRKKYEETFSTDNWKALSVEKQPKHTLASCKECRNQHHDLQHEFPLGPHYEHDPVVSVDVASLQELGKVKGTKRALIS